MRSRDLVAGLGTMTAIVLLAWQLPAFVADWRGLLRHELDSVARHPDQLFPVWHNDLVIFRGVALAASLSWLVATLGGVAQGGLVFAPAALTPNLSRLNPASRLGQLFSFSAVSHLLKALAADRRHRLSRGQPAGPGLDASASLLHASPRSHSSASVTSHMFELAWKGSLVLAGWSCADYFLERWRHENELKMSRRICATSSKRPKAIPR